MLLTVYHLCDVPFFIMLIGFAAACTLEELFFPATWTKPKFGLFNQNSLAACLAPGVDIVIAESAKRLTFGSVKHLIVSKRLVAITAKACNLQKLAVKHTITPCRGRAFKPFRM
jgi:hypothetical protein